MLPKIRTFLILTLISSSLAAQVRPTWSAAADIRSGARGTAIGTITHLDSSRNRVTMRLDGNRSDSTVIILSDTVSTRFLGFEGAGKISTGTSGFAKLRLGDRLEVRGVGTSSRNVDADEMILLGRGTTSGTGSTSGDTVEGTIRSVRASDNTFVVETSRREIYEVRARSNTPVYFEGKTFTIANLEPGDRVRVSVESRNDLDGITARSVEVTGDVSPGDSTTGGNSLSSVEGPITRIDTQLSTIRVNTSRGEIRVDARNAYDDQNRRLRLADYRIGDRISVTGQFETSGVFTADTIRLDRNSNNNDDPYNRDDDRDDSRDFGDEYDAVTLEGTVDRAWADGSFVVRDASNELYTVYSDRDFVVRTTAGNAISTRIRRSDKVTVRAFRDRAERYIAQGIRIR